MSGGRQLRPGALRRRCLRRAVRGGRTERAARRGVAASTGSGVLCRSRRRPPYEVRHAALVAAPVLLVLAGGPDPAAG
eukprot:5988861-Lingulodinium_polyedra.AAC.1